MDTFTLRELTFRYPQGARPALAGVSLSVRAGEFLVLCGPSGCGKSTLLRQLKTALTPHGERTGEVLFRGVPLERVDRREQSGRIGFVLQSPENQLVTDKVWHELSFGLESLGEDTPAIRRRVAEMASFFGLEDWFYRDVAELSGGQKQLLNLAAVMTLGPDVLVLDEPTSQLDPVAASDFLAALGRINRELGTTVVLSEHRLEEALPLADRAAVLDGGRLFCLGTPAEVGQALRAAGHPVAGAMPAPMRIWAAVESGLPCPVTVREGRQWLEDYAGDHSLAPLPPEPARPAAGAVLRAEGLWFRYEREGPDVVKGLDLTLGRGELLALLGGNGAGKTTALRLLSGVERPQRGSVERAGRVALLPQDPRTLFVKKTVREDLVELLPEGGDRARAEPDAARVAALCRLEGLLDRHPYDLSGGEQQRLALAKLLLLEPDILLLDEPTKGLDSGFKEELAGLLEDLLARGMSVLMVSHDVEFCAAHAHRCALFFDGAVAAEGTSRAFFSGNSFYTTAANRMARRLLPQAVTAEEVIRACGGTLPPQPQPPTPAEEAPPSPPDSAAGERGGALPAWRKVLALLGALAAGWAFWRAVTWGDLSALVGAEGLTAQGGAYLALCGVFLAGLLVLGLAAGRRRREAEPPVLAPPGGRRHTRRSLLAAAVFLLLIPLTLWAGMTWLEGRKYYFIALLILLECMVPLLLLFEGRRPQARELAVLAALCAIGVAGRAALFMLPQCKPVMALTTVAGAALGGEAGFLVGAMTMLVSNVLLGQGPWTPWQMFAMGLIGFLAGVLFRSGRIRPRRLALSLFGAVASVVVYGGILNPASALMWMDEVDWGVLLAYCAAGFPMDLVQGAATALFLWFGGEPMLEKLERLQAKYGLLE